MHAKAVVSALGALVAAMTLIGCASHRTIGSAPSLSATVMSSPPTSSPSATTDAFDRTFTGDGMFFDYPSSWTLYRFDDPAGSFYSSIALLSNEPLHDPCVTTHSSETCGNPLAQLGPGGVLIEWGQAFGIGDVFAEPAGTATTINGLPAIISRSPTSGTQCAGVPGAAQELDGYIQPTTTGWVMTACVADPGADQALGEAMATLTSFRLEPADTEQSPPAGSTPTSTPTPVPSTTNGNAIGDPDAIAQCQTAAAAEQTAVIAAGGDQQRLTVAAGFSTTTGAAQRYGDSIGFKPGDPPPPAAVENDKAHTSTTPIVACVLDGEIDASNTPGLSRIASTANLARALKCSP